jgi:hypothetical protein
MVYYKVPHSGNLSSGCSKIGFLKDEFKIAEEYHNLRGKGYAKRHKAPCYESKMISICIN